MSKVRYELFDLDNDDHLEGVCRLHPMQENFDLHSGKVIVIAIQDDEVVAMASTVTTGDSECLFVHTGDNWDGRLARGVLRKLETIQKGMKITSVDMTYPEGLDFARWVTTRKLKGQRISSKSTLVLLELSRSGDKKATFEVLTRLTKFINATARRFARDYDDAYAIIESLDAVRQGLPSCEARTLDELVLWTCQKIRRAVAVSRVKYKATA